jgi:hypothetical protein
MIAETSNCSNREDAGRLAKVFGAIAFFAQRRLIGWRSKVLWLAVTALILQSLNLFAPQMCALSPVEAAFAVLADLPGAAAAGTILCLNGDEAFNGKAPVHNHDSGSCPMCQIIGFSLAGAPEAEPLVLPTQRLSGVVAVPARAAAPRAPPHLSARPRAPPAIV